MTRLRDASRSAARATLLTLGISVVLAVVKVLTGIVGNSYALIADGVESLMDVVSALVVLGTLRISARPQSRRFPYGVGKAEPLGAMVVAGILLLAAGGIAIQAVREILSPHAAPAAFTLPVLLVVVATKEAIFRFLAARADEVESHALRTDAWHHRSDALTSLAAFVGISLALMMGEGWESADDWAALFACAIIGINGIRLFWRALIEVLDVAAPHEVEMAIRDLAHAVDRVTGIDVCRVRRSGLAYFVDIHVEVDGDLSVRDGHAIAHDVKDALLLGAIPVRDALVHIEPARTDGARQPSP